MSSNLSSDASFGSAERLRILRWAVFAVAMIYTGRLAYLQIIRGNVYRLKAEAQAIKQIKIEPFRGNFIDRNGRFIVQNAPGFSVTITPYEVTPEAIHQLARILGVTDTALSVEIAKARKHNKFAAAKISAGKDVGYDVISAIEEQRDMLPGVDIIVDPKRLYAFDGNASHLLGYTREVSERQLKSIGDSYDPGDVTGQTGLERAYEPFVRGQKGLQFVAVNKSGQRVASFNDGKSDQPALEGFDLYLGLDIELQELSEKLMKGKRGGIVALDPNNGEILCFTSMPDYDLRNFTGKTTSKYYSSLNADPEKPLINRASKPIYPPGSTWKPLMALMGLEEGVITEKSTLYCAGGYQFGNHFAKCHGGVHGPIDVKRAIAVSCNSFFYQVGLKLGVDKFHYWGQMFGFGQPTRADIQEESAGILPSTAYMNRVHGKNGWTRAALMNWGIGQGEVSVTPLQMAAYIATIANEGTWYQPHALREMYNKVTKTRNKNGYDKHEIPVEKRFFQIVKQGMREVVIAGTARAVDIPGLDVCGKTGTAQTGGKDQSWFVCFAPMDNPKIALVVTVEEGGFGSTTAGPIARALLENYFLKKWPATVPHDSTRAQIAGAVAAPRPVSPDSQQLPDGPFFKPRPVAVPAEPRKAPPVAAHTTATPR